MTADELSVLNLKDDYEAVLQLPDAERWALDLLGSLEVLSTMAPTPAAHELFQARWLWGKYPDEAPSLKFRDPDTGRLDVASAWPVVRGFRPQSLDACVNWCSEGFALHPEWRRDPRMAWDSHGNPLLRVLRTLQDELDTQFQRRFR